MEYRIVVSGASATLEKRVMMHIQEGWQPLGGVVCTDDGLWAQAMIRTKS